MMTSLSIPNSFKVLTAMLISINFGAFNQAKSQETPYELKGKNYTATYEECIEYYKQLDQTYRCVSMIEAGETDAGLPLHTVLISSDGRFDPARWKQEEKIIILINNGIHPRRTGWHRRIHDAGT
jgi:hypothetical protein